MVRISFAIQRLREAALEFKTSFLYRRFVSVSVVAIAAVALSACGGDDKPAFCADRSSFESSVNEIPKLVSEGNLSDLRSQVETVETEAGTLADSARNDYPQETDAIESSVESLRTSIEDLPQDPEPAQLAALGVEAATAISAVTNFINATNSDCD